jgi:hypothetical protein
MAVDQDSPKLKLAFSGEAFRAGAVPITVVAAKLQALQNLLFHAVAAVKRDNTNRRGLWFNKYRAVAELTFSNAHHSDLVIEAELAPDPVLSDAFSVGKQAVDLVFRFGAAVETGKSDDVDISRDDRSYLLRALEGLMPNATDQYQVVLENCDAASHPKLTLTPESRIRLRRQAARSGVAPLEEATLVGELIKIHVDSGEDKITVRSGPREIDCFYPDSFRDQIANLLAGSIVEVTGRATLDDRGEVRKLSEVIDVDTVSLEPLRISRFEFAGRRYALSAPVTVTVTYSDGLWVYANESLNLWGYADRREDALRDLHESFDYMYREIAEEAEESLDNLAKQLKRRLRGLVVLPDGGSVTRA